MEICTAFKNYLKVKQLLGLWEVASKLSDQLYYEVHIFSLEDSKSYECGYLNDIKFLSLFKLLLLDLLFPMLAI